MSVTTTSASLPPILIINLQESKDRLTSIATNLDRLGLSWQRFDAVDGRHLDQDQQKKAGYRDEINQRDAFRPLNGGEIGCFLSHRAAWQHILDQSLDAALILEDDAFPLFEGQRELQQALDLATDYPIVRLNGNKSGLAFAKTQAKRHGFKLKSYALPPFQTTATFVTKAGAQTLLQETETFGLPIDGFYAMPWRHGKAKVTCLTPAIFGNDPLTYTQTTIQHKKPRGENKLKREISRAIYRLRLRARAVWFFCSKH